MFVTYLTMGTLFGIVITKAQVISWYRIQEMFRFQSFHMYGVLCSAILMAFVGLRVVRASGVRSLAGDIISVPPKVRGSGYRYVIGGALFGIGWALTVACPGPLLALVGTGAGVMVVVIGSAIVGTWCYGALRSRLPH